MLMHNLPFPFNNYLHIRYAVQKAGPPAGTGYTPARFPVGTTDNLTGMNCIALPDLLPGRLPGLRSEETLFHGCDPCCEFPHRECNARDIRSNALPCRRIEPVGNCPEVLRLLFGPRVWRMEHHPGEVGIGKNPVTV
jgi:hypothetical protein